jgi:hypothetical protein
MDGGGRLCFQGGDNMKLKRIIAVAMATTMVMAMSITALADGEPVTSGDTTGAGSSEGHVVQKLISVTLPTSVAASTFAYTMDPERLISATAGERWANSSFPSGTADKGVYFANGKVGGDGDDKDYTKYESTSPELTVINNSSHKIKLTVKAEAVASTKDIPLIAKTAVADAEDAGLYLGLIVGSEDPVALSATAAATKSVEIAGTSANFKVAAKSDNSGYEYRALTLEEFKTKTNNASAQQSDYDATWARTTFKIEGAATSGKEIAADTTAPSIKVTWSYEDPDAATAVTVDLIKNSSNVSFIAGEFADAVEGNLDASKITSVKANGVDVTEFASIGRNTLILLPWTDVKTALNITSMSDISNTLEVVYVYDGNTYKGTYVKQ